MSLETAIAELTEAVKENTAAHAKLAEVATAAAGGSTGGTTSTKSETKKTETKKDEAPKEPVLKEKVTAAALKKVAAAFLDGDDEETRDANKQNFIGALAHLGAAKLGEVKTNEDRARLAGYIAYWNAGLDVDFEEIDAKLAGDEDGDGDSDGDDLLG